MKMFQQEKEFFTKHIQDNISNHCKKQFVDNLPVQFQTLLVGGSSLYTVDLQYTPFEIESIFIDREFGLIEDSKNPEMPITVLESLIASFGRDAFGLYLPFLP